MLCVIIAAVHRCVGTGVCIEWVDLSHTTWTHCTVVLAAAGKPWPAADLPARGRHGGRQLTLHHQRATSRIFSMLAQLSRKQQCTQGVLWKGGGKWVLRNNGEIMELENNRHRSTAPGPVVFFPALLFSPFSSNTFSVVLYRGDSCMQSM